MRTLTRYEHKKWFADYNIFERPEYIEEGTEWSDFMANLAALCEMGSSYGMSDEFETACVVEYLDQYYGHIKYIYEGSWGYETPEDVGLPPSDKVDARMTRATELGVDPWTAFRMAIDWAMRWREQHLEEFYDRQRTERLREELKRLENR